MVYFMITYLAMLIFSNEKTSVFQMTSVGAHWDKLGMGSIGTFDIRVIRLSFSNCCYIFSYTVYVTFSHFV